MKIFKWLDRKVELGDPGPKIEYLTTMDLDVNNKLYSDFLGRRAARKKAREKAKQDSFYQVGEDVY